MIDPEGIDPEGDENGGTDRALTIDGATGSVDPPPPKIDLAKAIDVRREMAKVYREMRAKKIDAADGTKFIYALTAIGKMIEIHEIEARIEALEERHGKSLATTR